MRQSDLFIIPRRPWNAGRLIGPKAPLKPKHIWAIRQQLKVAKRVRDLAMFNCALDAKLRACDLVKLRVSDVAPGGSLRLRSTVIQQKTGRPVPFEITEPARDAIGAWLELRGQRDDDWLFPSRNHAGCHIGTRQYARLVDQWIRLIDLEPRLTAPIASGARRSHSSTRRPATCAHASCFSVTASWRAPYATLASKLTTPWSSLSRSISDTDRVRSADPAFVR